MIQCRAHGRRRGSSARRALQSRIMYDQARSTRPSVRRKSTAKKSLMAMLTIPNETNRLQPPRLKRSRLMLARLLQRQRVRPRQIPHMALAKI